ncbi:hypothetical protein MMC22_009516 [Lobaria immixta]|nr:hypothetical protein [Lobaria immixta]
MFVTFYFGNILYCPTDNFPSDFYVFHADFQCFKVPKVANVKCLYLSDFYTDHRCSKVPKVANVKCCKSMLDDQTPEFLRSSVTDGSEKVAFAGEQVSSVGDDIRFTGIKPFSTGEQGSSAGEQVPPIENFSFAGLQLPSLGEQPSLPELRSPSIESQLPSTGQHFSFSDAPTASSENLFASSYQDPYASEGAGNTIGPMKPNGIDGTDNQFTGDLVANDFV